MNCYECSSSMVQRAAGVLARDVADAVDAHVKGCPQCKRDMQSTAWLRDAVGNDEKRVAAGHLSAQLLYRYADKTSALDDATMESIAAHLDSCGRCMDEVDRVRELMRSPKGQPVDPVQAPTPGPRPQITRSAPTSHRSPLQALNALFIAARQWISANRRIAAGAALIVVAAAIGLYATRFAGAPTVARFASPDVVASRVPLQDLPVKLVARGREKVGPTAISFRGAREFVVAVDLDAINGGSNAYDAVLLDSQGKEIFRGTILASAFRDGRFFLRLFARRIPAATYTLVIEGIDGTTRRTIARSVFTVQR